MKPHLLYSVVNKGKMRRYKITGVNAKHFRHEEVNGRIILVAYCGPGTKVPDCRDIIELTPADAARHSHLKLLELGRESIDLNPAVLVIPDDWENHDSKSILDWASQIVGKKVGNVAKATKIIEDYRNGSSND